MCSIGLITYIFSRNELFHAPTLAGEEPCQWASGYLTTVNPMWTKCSVVFPEGTEQKSGKVCKTQSLGASALATLTLDNCLFS